MGHYAEHHDWATQKSTRALERKLRELGWRATFHIYPGTNHAFFNDSRPEAYHREAAALAWKRTIAFLDETLG